MTENNRYVIHLPVTATDLATAQRLARVLGRWARVIPAADPGELTVSPEDDQGAHHRVFCDARMPDGRRCLLRADHDGDCSRRLLR
jgi:hypothetical protein